VTIVDFAADSILVLLDVGADGKLAKSSAGLIGAASRIGTPVALVVAPPAAADGLATEAGAFGASTVLVAGVDDSQLSVPAVDALEAAAALVDPDAVLASHSVEGRELAARFAARSRSALAVDAVGVSRDADGVVAHHSTPPSPLARR
jgi:electron transfer flavoprotein alpha subunit